MLCHLEDAEWKGATLRGQASPDAPLRWVAADVTRLPFPDRYIDFVVTQYLLDIVPDPARVIREVNRVLKTGGVWSGFGLPFRLSTDPDAFGRRTGEDLPALAEAFGFETIAIDRRSSMHLDTEGLSPWSGRREHRVIHSVARKARDLPASAETRAFAAYFAGERSPLLGMVPSIRPSEGIRISRRIGTEGDRRDPELHAGKVHCVLNETTTAQVLAFFGAIDSARSVGSLVEAMERCEHPVGERDVVLALLALGHGGVVDLS